MNLPEDVVKKLKDVNVASAHDFLNCSVSTLVQRCGLNCDQVMKMKRNVFKETFEALKLRPETIFESDLAFGSLKGNHLYEFYGGPGTGKTQLCLYLAARISHVEPNGKVLYLDTKNDLSIGRLKAFAQSEEQSFGNVLVSKVFDIHQAIQLTQKLCEENQESPSISILILDNITSLILPIVDEDEVTDIFSHIGELIGNLKEISSRQNCPVIMTNNAIKNGTCPALGKFLENAADVQFSIQHDQEEVGSRLLKLCYGPYQFLQEPFLQFTISKTNIQVKK